MQRPRFDGLPRIKKQKMDFALKGMIWKLEHGELETKFDWKWRDDGGKMTRRAQQRE